MNDLEELLHELLEDEEFKKEYVTYFAKKPATPATRSGWFFSSTFHF